MAHSEDLYKVLLSAHEKYLNLNKRLEVERDQKEIIRINKNLSKLRKISQEFLKYQEELNNLKECHEIISKDSNQEFVKLAQSEMELTKKKIQKHEQELKQMLLPEDENEDKNVIIEMRAAAGGDESSIFVSNLFDSYKKYSDLNKWKISIIELNQNHCGIYYLSFSLSGEKVYSKMKFESGVHRVQRVPETEAKGRVHTSTITVSVMPEQEEIEVSINPNDLRIDVFRASGAGGQHVNKTESAVRITHIPTGIVVACQQERSQITNREFAMRLLRAKLWNLEHEKQSKEISQQIKQQVGRGSRSEKIRTYNYPQNRITDHRISLTLNKLSEIMMGDFSEIHGNLINFQKNQELEKLFFEGA